MLGELEATKARSAETESRKRGLTSPGSAKKPNETFTTPPAKKLKQARLPFTPISSPPVIQVCSPSPNDRPSKKRKLSETDISASSPQPTTKPKEKTDVISNVKKSATKAAGKKTPGKNTPGKNTLGKNTPGKNTSGKNVKAVKQPEPNPSVVEIEVSSSSEDAASKSPSKNKKKPKPLECFLLATEQPTSTSDEEVIDLAGGKASDNKKDEELHQNKAEDKDKKSVSPKGVTATDDSGDGNQEVKDATTGHDQIDEIDSVSGDEASATESILDGSIASEANTSISSQGSAVEANDEHSKVADSSQVTNSISSTPKSALNPPRKTPKSAKSLMKEQEKEKKRQEKIKLREEKRLKAEQEKAEKKKLKEAARAEKETKAAEAKRLKELEKEQKQKEKQEKLEQEEKERMEKKAMKEEKQKQKMKELEAKAEEKKKKEEEKLKVEEEKAQKEAAKRQAAEKQQNRFKSFFKKIDTTVETKEPEEKCCGGFAPFQVQKDMALAPVCGFEKLQNQEAQEEFDNMIKSQDENTLYLKQLKSGKYRAGRRGRTELRKDNVTESAINANDEDSIQMLEEAKVKKTKTKAKLLQFHQNYRPAYYGTWSKISKTISPRNYLKKDEDFLDYEFDSDEEWEEPGESLSNSEGEDSDGDSDGGDDSDNDGFFVEHGYLSESEDPLDEEETVEQWRAKRAAKALAWEVELKRQTQVLKPVIVGCFWQNGPKNQSGFFKCKLQAFKAVTLVNVPVQTSHSARKSPHVTLEDEKKSPTSTSQAGGQTKSGAMQKKPVPEEAMAHLLRLVHGNTIGIKSLIREFREYWQKQQRPSTPKISTPILVSSSDSPASMETTSVSPKSTPPASGATPTPLLEKASPDVDSSSPKPTQTGEITSTNSTPDEPEIDYAISKRQLEMKITSIAIREKRQNIYPRICWYVHKNILEKYKMTDLPVPSQWEHLTGPLAVKRSDSPLPLQNNILPPQKVVSAPAANARRIIPTKIGGSPGAPSVMSLLQQQKSVLKPKPVVNSLPVSGAAGLLANAAALCSAQQQAPSLGNMLPTISAASIMNTSNQPNVGQVPQLAPGVPVTQINTTPMIHHPQSTHNASVVGATQPQVLPPQSTTPQASETKEPPKPAKKVLTLKSFFGTASKKPTAQEDAQSKSLKSNGGQDQEKPETITESKMEGVEVASPKVSPANSNTGSKENKSELLVIKDLLSQAKENRLKKQMSPDRKKTSVKSKADAESAPVNSNETNKVDKAEVITIE